MEKWWGVLGVGSVTWTEAQKDAIYTRGCDILVAAGAGAGKTAVLVERVIQGVLADQDGLDIERLLVVTFTEAAATEMRQRIRDALADKLTKDPNNERLHRQLNQLPFASISTIHAFCSKLLRQHFYHLGLDPSFRIMTEPEANLLRHETIDWVLTQCFAAADPSVLAFIDAYGGRGGDGAVQDLILRLYAFQMSLPEPKAWQKAMLEAHAPRSPKALYRLPLMEEARRQVMLTTSRVLSMLLEARALCSLPEGPWPYADRLEQEILAVQDFAELMAREGWVHDASGWADIFERLPSVRKDAGVTDQLKTDCQRLRNAAKELWQKMLVSHFSLGIEEIIEELYLLRPSVEILFMLVNQFSDAYGNIKQKQGVLDFADLEQLTLQLLTKPKAGGGLVPSSVALELEKQFDEVLIDEYQDTNGVQDAIMAMVTGATRKGPGYVPRFMVGDIKQSIYGFRLTEPRLFLEKYTEFAPHAGAPQRRIDLATNFRCRGEIIHGVNYVFRQLMDVGVAGMEYDDEAELRQGAHYPELTAEVRESVEVAATSELVADLVMDELGGKRVHGAKSAPRLEVYILDSKQEQGSIPETEGLLADDGPKTGNQSDLWSDEFERLEREAWLVACRIRQMVDQDNPLGPHLVWDKAIKTYRPVEYRDIVVLLRSVKNRANQVMEIFRQAGIPAYADLDTGYFSAVEIRLMVSLLQVLDNPKQDIPLAAVLRAPWFDLSPEDLVAIRQAAPRASFHDAMLVAAKADNQLGKRLRDIDATLDAWRTMARRLPLSKLISYLYKETGFYHYATTMPKGEQRQANLRGLHDRAREFDQFALQGLSRFVDFLQRLQKDDNLGEIKSLAEGANVVRVMSMHKSKGLEFPIVFLADLGKGFNLQDQLQDVLFHKELGPGFKVVDPEARIKYSAFAHYVIKGRMHRETLAEEMRILYVAMTRARETLILVGSQGPLDTRCASWANAATITGWPLPDDLVISAGNYLDWLGPALARHKDGLPILAAGNAKTDGRSDLWQDAQVADDASRWLVWLEGLCEPLNWFDIQRPGQSADTIPWNEVAKLKPVYPETLTKEKAAILNEELLWQYPYQGLTNLPAKISVTELKNWYQRAVMDAGVEGEQGAAEHIHRKIPQGIRYRARRPRFVLAEHERVSAVEQGMWTHTLLQCLDLTKDLSDRTVLESEAQRLVEQRFLTSHQLAYVDLGSIVSFFGSSLGQRLLANPEGVRRELPFTMALSAKALYGAIAVTAIGDGRSKTDARGGQLQTEAKSEVKPEAEPQPKDQVIIQGVIDCLVEEPQGLLLVDFKTDRVTEASAARVALNYQVQIEQYCQAARAIFGHDVREAYLYFLQGKIAVPMRISGSLASIILPK